MTMPAHQQNMFVYRNNYTENINFLQSISTPSKCNLNLTIFFFSVPRCPRYDIYRNRFPNGIPKALRIQLRGIYIFIRILYRPMVSFMSGILRAQRRLQNRIGDRKVKSEIECG